MGIALLAAWLFFYTPQHPEWIDDILLFGQGQQGLADQAGLEYPQGFASLL